MERPTFSANTGFLWTDRPVLERIVAAGRAGFDAVELHDEWRGETIDDLRAALREAGRGGTALRLLGINTRMGETSGAAAIPGDEDGAREDIDEAIEAASALGDRAVHVLAGKVRRTPETLAAYHPNLGYACARAARARNEHAPDGLTVLIEPLSKVARPVYPLRTLAQAAATLDRVGAPNLRVLFDVFHVHAEGDDLATAMREHVDRVGHVQIADPVTRHEPRAEDPHAIGPLLAAFRAAGYEGPFGCEYVPEGSVEDGLGWRESL